MPYGQIKPDDFTLSNRSLLLWLIGVFVVVIPLVMFFPPALWLCDVGGLLLALGVIANSARTNQWYTWQRGGNLSWFEGWCVSTGALLAIPPLLAMLVRSQR
jgi:hypothetical protein